MKNYYDERLLLLQASNILPLFEKKSPHLALCDMSKWAHKLLGQMLMRVNLIGKSGFNLSKPST
jgi:hypothetical protein